MTTTLSHLTHENLLSHLKNLVNEHKKYELEILLGIREVIARNLDLKAGFANLAEYCETMFGMSIDMAWKKVRVANIIGPYPKLLELLKEGKTHLSHVSMVASRITQANQDEIYKFLPGASRRDSSS